MNCPAVTTTAVIQTKTGIGDAIWHLPFIRAIAAATKEGSVAFMAPPSSHASELFVAEPAIARVIYFENQGSELTRGLQLWRLFRLLRAAKFETVWILDRSVRPAFAAFCAGVPHRIGLGLGSQKLYITNRGIDPALRRAWVTTWLVELMKAMAVPFAGTEPQLRLPADIVARIGARFAQLPHPWIAAAFGGSHPSKEWPVEYWRTFLTELRAHTMGSVFLIGGPNCVAQADDMVARTVGPAPMINACALSLIEVAALLSQTDLFIGHDSGPLNIAAAVGIPAYGLFGSTHVLDYSRHIRPILPDDGRPYSPDGMRRISPGAAFAAIAAELEMLENKARRRAALTPPSSP